MKLLVGLGNPGPTYTYTRHNIGFLIIDKILHRVSANNISKKSFLGELYKYKDMLLLKPTTFMNLSGKSVQAVANFYKIKPDDILVIHDDIDLPFGAIKLKKGGGHGGHNGLKSIDSLITKEYNRLRLGVDKPEYKSQVADYVLSKFNEDEQKLLDDFLEYGADAALGFLDTPLIELKSKYSKRDASYLEK
jgi:PTH1 family peptidyl-tRNA hydrolase